MLSAKQFLRALVLAQQRLESEGEKEEQHSLLDKLHRLEEMTNAIALRKNPPQLRRIRARLEEIKSELLNVPRH
jgi:hypothetical protein